MRLLGKMILWIPLTLLAMSVGGGLTASAVRLYNEDLAGFLLFMCAIIVVLWLTIYLTFYRKK